MLRQMGTTAVAGALLCTTALSYAYLGRPNSQPPADDPPDLLGPVAASFTSAGGSLAAAASQTEHPGAVSLDMDLLALPAVEVASASVVEGPGEADDGLKERISSAGTALLFGMGLLALAAVRHRQSPPSAR